MADMQTHVIRQSPQGHRRESDGAKREPKEKTVRPNPVADDGHTFLALLQERQGAREEWPDQMLAKGWGAGRAIGGKDPGDNRCLNRRTCRFKTGSGRHTNRIRWHGQQDGGADTAGFAAALG